ncbi:MFS transporter [Amycolatopsis suaedae]|uniref:MFS transporter n=1 Tax=Amycolatopsis suaedae TaxID=2510978 RepID=A0A4V2EL93_9PSEU|nr:MFS transporter [Amycolatopsis suaedae]RZQ60765.1 MFS transporter [Amycolatopsis suaedae]
MLTTVPTRRRLRTKLTLATQVGQGIDGYVLGGIGAALPAITTDLAMSEWTAGLIGASALIGIFVGGPLFGWFADRYGRRIVFLTDMVLFLVGSIAQFFVADAWQLFVIRLLMGIAIGGEYAIGAPLLSEYAPRHNRGKLLASLEVSWYAGFMLAFAVGYALSEVDDGWRWTLGSSTVIALVCLALRGGIPESARWLLSKGRRAEAEDLIERYELEVDVETELADAERRDSLRALFTREHVRSTVFASSFWAALVLPYFAIGTFSPQVLETLGFGDDALAGSLASNGIAVLGVAAGCLLVERIGRRRLLIPPFWITAAALAVIGFWPTAPMAVVVICFLTFSFLNAASSALTAVYPLEVFPTAIRTTGVGFATAMSRVGAAVGTFLLPVALTHLGTGPTLLIGAAVLAAGAVLSHFLAPETTGLDLSQAVRTVRRTSEG